MPALLALLSAAVWGASDFAAGVISRTLRPVVVVAWSQSMALVLLTAIVAFRGLPEQGFAGWFPWAMLAGVSGAMGLLCFYAALSTGTMGVVAPIAAVGSGIPVLLGVLSGEKPSALAWWGIAVAIAGVVLASGPEMKEGLGARPVLLACLAAVGFGVALFALDRGARVSLLHTLWGMRLTSAIGYAALALAARSLGGVARRHVPVLAAVGAGDLAANALFGMASSMGMVSVAAVLGSLYPVMTILLARYFLNERLRRIQVIGSTLALCGVVLIAAGGRG
ncbi:MAG: DMT family transporter [Actinomycetales bacterium]|uniref:DMT family transporter n=1 Tax=Candidatus Phosphoribacter hodrii TaxID=2953743 RepID=A0A935M4Y3_9MICO|nr:DMT family transporter [Candidatus Phosphoribacter hodrii]